MDKVDCCVIILIFVIFLYKRYKRHNSTWEYFSSSLTSTDSQSSDTALPSNEKNSGLLPVLSPYFNIREICKESILLEGHLTNKRKRCVDCIKKHFLSIEGLAEELVSLDKKQELNEDYYNLAEMYRRIQKMYIEHENPLDIVQELRKIRKSLLTNKIFAFGIIK
jgi:hypothetical protein